MGSEVFDSVIKQLQLHLPQENQARPIGANTDLQNELGLDSLRLATVATDLHAKMEFDLQYFAENLGEIRLVSDLVRIVEEALTQKN